MNHCKYCNKEIPEKTVKGTPRTFCNKSCARKHYCENNPEKVKQAGRKSFETIRDTKPEVLKHRGRTTPKKRKAYDEMKENGHYQKMSKLGKVTMFEKYGDYFIREKERETKIANGKWLDYSIFDFDEVKRYTRAVRKLTRDLYGSAGYGYHWDHIVPISKAFILKIPPEILCKKENIRKMKAEENLSKGNKITSEALLILENWGISADDLF
jgi:hypothetical protein